MISGISATVMAFVVAAMVIVLSVFNGIESLVHNLYSSTDADVRIEASLGKWLNANPELLNLLNDTAEVKSWSAVLQEEVLLQYGDKQVIADLKGVDSNYPKVLGLDSFMIEGPSGIFEQSRSYLVLGAGLRQELGVPSLESLRGRIQVYSLPIGEAINSQAFQTPFLQNNLPLAGVLSLNAEFDTRMAFTSLLAMQSILNDSTKWSAVEIKLQGERLSSEWKQAVESLGLKITTREQKNALIYQTSKTEKWITFFILFFIVLIAAFNMSASLTMLIIDKRRDLEVLKILGMERSTMIQIFFQQGLLIMLTGMIAGLLLGLSFCYAQLQWGLVRFEGSIVPYYPVEVHVWDLLLILAMMAVLASLSFWAVKALFERFFVSSAYQSSTN